MIPRRLLTANYPCPNLKRHQGRTVSTGRYPPSSASLALSLRPDLISERSILSISFTDLGKGGGGSWPPAIPPQALLPNGRTLSLLEPFRGGGPQDGRLSRGIIKPTASRRRTYGNPSGVLPHTQFPQQLFLGSSTRLGATNPPAGHLSRHGRNERPFHVEDTYPTGENGPRDRLQGPSRKRHSNFIWVLPPGPVPQTPKLGTPHVVDVMRGYFMSGHIPN